MQRTDRGAQQSERYGQNKQAFDSIIGDPFAVPEPIMGYYTRIKCRSDIAATRNAFDEGRATGNPARPSLIDFQCDVERAVEDTLEKNVLIYFVNTYITETSETLFTAQERVLLEQKLGKVFRERGISPVSRYFTTVRQSIGTTRRGNKEQNAKRSYAGHQLQ